MKQFLYSIVFVFISLQLTAQELVAPEHVLIESGEWKLYGDLYRAKGRSKTPVVLMLNKANGNRAAYSDLAKSLLGYGISSLTIDLRGHGASINQGKFIPFDSVNNAKLNLDDSYLDVAAAHKYLIGRQIFDTSALFMIGASYSGEAMMEAARYFKVASGYIALSPGSFSDTSIAQLNSLSLAVLFIKSFEERSMQGFETDVFSKSTNSAFIVVPGKYHATDILGQHRYITPMICGWLNDCVKRIAQQKH